MPSDFIAQLTLQGGPPPDLEVQSVLQRAELDGEVWFPTRKPGSGWAKDRHGVSRAIVFFRVDAIAIAGFTAEIVEKRLEPPPDAELSRMYGMHGAFGAWWLLRNVEALPPDATLYSIPGASVAGSRSAAESFAGSNTFSYWSFGTDAPVPTDRRQSNTPITTLSRRDPSLLWHRPVDGVPLYGVDFSGAEEDGYGNPKLWAAAWTPGAGTSVRLRCGTDPGVRFSRGDLAAEIARSPGFWVLDFPFGVAAETSAAIGLHPNSWNEWLAWASSSSGNRYDATERRDVARASVSGAGARWSALRETDRQVGTTWFPLFEQLYRQTLLGARDVLKPLSRADLVAVVPFAGDALEGKRTIVVEGFPGAVIERRLGLSSRGYKGSSEGHAGARRAIVGRLTEPPFAIPIDAYARSRAVRDAEGDAVDALVLLLAAAEASLTSRDGWRERLEMQVSSGRGAEGWIVV